MERDGVDMDMPLAVMCCVRTSSIARVKPPPTAPAMLENLMLICTLCWH